MKYSVVLLSLLLTISCNQRKKTDQNDTADVETKMVLDSVSKDSTNKVAKPAVKSFEGLDDTTFVRLADFI